MTQLTDHFMLEEFIESKVAVKKRIDNTPSEEIKKQLLFTAAGLERIRAVLNFPIEIVSGFRCLVLNAAVGGSENSQHMKGEAVDFISPHRGTPKEVAKCLESRVKMLGIDQLILEPGWVHVSFTLRPRYQVFTLVGSKYVKGIV